jgi:hypothetical protein
MRRRLLFLVSACLNLVLAALLLWPRLHPPPPISGGSAEGTNKTAVETRFRTQVVVRKQFFSWAEVESPDYPVYIARLREIVCPEQTIRDIVIAVVTQLYARKRMAEVVTPDQQWWCSDPDTNVVQAANAKIQALDLERRAMLAALLGPNWEAGNPDNLVVALKGQLLGSSRCRTSSPAISSARANITTPSKSSASPPTPPRSRGSNNRPVRNWPNC